MILGYMQVSSGGRDGGVKSPLMYGKKCLPYIWKDRIKNIDEVAGFEYWANISTFKTKDSSWHQDKDEKLYIDKQLIDHPTQTAILYTQREDIVGGCIEIAKDSCEDLCYLELESLQRIEAKHNRLLIMDPRCFHKASRVYKGCRQSFMSSTWFIKTYEIKKHEALSSSLLNEEKGNIQCVNGLFSKGGV